MLRAVCNFLFCPASNLSPYKRQHGQRLDGSVKDRKEGDVGCGQGIQNWKDQKFSPMPLFLHVGKLRPREGKGPG